MVTDHAFLGKVFGHFDFWTFFLSIFENPKILCSKKYEKREKKNKLEKGLKEKSSKAGPKYIFQNNLKNPPKIYISKQLKEPTQNIYFKTT